MIVSEIFIFFPSEYAQASTPKSMILMSWENILCVQKIFVYSHFRDAISVNIKKKNLFIMDIFRGPDWIVWRAGSGPRAAI